jgi:hypothetical protein
MNLEPDGIITDEPEKAKEILQNMKRNGYWDNYVKRLREL